MRLHSIEALFTLLAGWRLVRQEGGISVYRRHMQGDSDQGSRYACVKCHGEVRAAPDKVFELLTDETRTKEFNSLYDKGRYCTSSLADCPAVKFAFQLSTALSGSNFLLHRYVSVQFMC